MEEHRWNSRKTNVLRFVFEYRQLVIKNRKPNLTIGGRSAPSEQSCCIGTALFAFQILQLIEALPRQNNLIALHCTHLQLMTKDGQKWHAPTSHESTMTPTVTHGTMGPIPSSKCRRRSFATGKTIALPTIEPRAVRDTPRTDLMLLSFNLPNFLWPMPRANSWSLVMRLYLAT